MRVLYTDGGSIGNGRLDQRARMAVFDAELGRIVVDADLGALTNNEAEYRAIDAALDYAAAERAGPVEIRSDSQLCVNQVRGEWKVKEPRLQPWVERVRRKLRDNRGRITWVPRGQNMAGRFLEGLEPRLAGPAPASQAAPDGQAAPTGESTPFCQRCGARMLERLVDHRPRPVCPKCGWTLFLDPKVAVAAVLELDGGVLLCRRAIEPGLGKWSFPAGFVDRGEELRAALRREVVEETGLTPELGRLVGVYSETGNPVVLIVFAGRAEGVPRPSAEASELRVFPPDEPPELAFGHDRQVLADWRRDRP
jgi:ADP-ribose pyrophosphatase YjhB (NUDIX family)/ribonuclease HI